MFTPTTTTQYTALLGFPLSHSASPGMHNRVYEKLGMNCCYLPIEVSEENLEALLTGMKVMNFVGFNVTIPHKLNIIPLLDELDSLAEKIGAVNTVRIRNGRTTGFNTDGEGFVKSLEEEGKISVAGKRFFILGCGGATRAIAFTLAECGAEEIIICNRTEEKAERLAAEVSAKTGASTTTVSQKDDKMIAAAHKADVMINTTSIGMHPHEDALPCPEDCILARHIVADIVYNPYTTKLLKTAEMRGAGIVHGLGMLVYQGAKAFTIFTEQAPDVEVMKDEVYKLLHKP